MAQAIGSALGSIPSVLGFSPTAAAAGPSDAAALPPVPNVDLSSTPSTSGGPTLLPSGDASSSGGMMAPPTPSLLTAPTAGAPYSLLPGAASGMPALAGGGGTDPFGNITPSAVDASGNPIAPTPGGGGAPSFMSRIISALTGKDPSKGGTGAFIGDIGNLSEAIQRFMVQRSLQNPQDVLKNSQVLSRGLSKGLKRDVGAAVGQEMAGAGLAGAPNLYAQAVTSALAPYRFQEQQNALREYLAAMQESMGAYPGTGGLFGPYGGYGAYPGEEQQQQQATPS